LLFSHPFKVSAKSFEFIYIPPNGCLNLYSSGSVIASKFSWSGWRVLALEMVSATYLSSLFDSDFSLLPVTAVLSGCILAILLVWACTRSKTEATAEFWADSRLNLLKYY
jgi:hypothetical protein